MTPVRHETFRLIADDLTGALDSAAPFARAERPVTVILDTSAEEMPALCAISTESRNMSAAKAVASIEEAFGRLMHGTTVNTLWFKKIDSVLRGHPFDETAVLSRLLGKTSCIFAPAFPAERRITVDGWQVIERNGKWLRLPNGNMRAGLARAGVAEAIVLDAETQDDLARHVAPWMSRGDALWAGARGLAEALAGERTYLPHPTVLAIIVGTTHPSTQAQVALLRTAGLPVTLHNLAAECPDPIATLAAVRQLFEGRARTSFGVPQFERALLFVGGETLAAALDAAGAQAVEVVGEVAPGVPCGKIIGGSLCGQTILTKSGGFGTPGCLVWLATKASRGEAPM